MATTHQITTAKQLLDRPDLERCELLCGKLVVMAPAGFEHGRIVANITEALVAYVEQEKLGVVAGAGTGFQIAHDPDTVRAPDVAFIRAGLRLAGGRDLRTVKFPRRSI